MRGCISPLPCLAAGGHYSREGRRGRAGSHREHSGAPSNSSSRIRGFCPREGPWQRQREMSGRVEATTARRKSGGNSKAPQECAGDPSPPIPGYRTSPHVHCLDRVGRSETQAGRSNSAGRVPTHFSWRKHGGAKVTGRAVYMQVEKRSSRSPLRRAPDST